MGKSKLLNKILGKTIPFLLASTMIYTLYVGKVEGYLQRGFGFFPDKFDKKTSEQVIKDVSSWKDAKNYILTHLTYCSDNKNYGCDFEAPFRTIHKQRKDDCDGGATAASALLSDNSKYEIKKMTLYTKSNWVASLILTNHVVALVYDKETKKYGSLGINPCDNIKPKYDSQEKVFKKLNQSFFWTFGNFSCSKYNASSLIDGMHPIKKSILNHNLEDKLNGINSKLFIAYTPFKIEQDDEAFENQKFLFIEESELNKFNYQDISEWNRLYSERKRISNNEFNALNSNKPISCSFYDKETLTDVKNFSVYSE